MKIKSISFPVVLVLSLFNPVLQAQDTISRSSGKLGTTYLAEYAFDGDETSRWVSKKNEQTAWLLYDFHKSVSFENIIIHWENTSAKEFCIQSSGNGEDWNTVYHEKNGKGGLTTLNHLEFQGRFFRILSINKDPALCYSIWDITFPDPEPARIVELRKRETEKRRKAKLNAIKKQLNFEEIVFAVREDCKDHVWGHWYANFAYYCLDPSYKNYGKQGRLCKYNMSTGNISTLVNDPEGTVRDPQLHYDGQKILFSWRKAGSEHFHIYEINVDGTGLKQLTFGPYADIEPIYLPDGGIIFVSSRCNRWVNCWQVPVATIYRCDGDGKNIRQLSANIEHDNTPWVLPDGQILYTRWEYIDRSQVHYHHLWTMKPDGTNQMVYYGNLNPGNVFIDAKPIPGSSSIVLSCSPGHGQTDHSGRVATANISNGPDDLNQLKYLSQGSDFRDPYPLSEDLYIAASGNKMFFIDSEGNELPFFSLPPEFGHTNVQEPRPLTGRKREPVIPSRVDLSKGTGTLFVNDVYTGRNMEGIKQGEIKKLLILEALPKPCQFTGSMEPLTWGGSFTLERILGTVPVEADGSAIMELPANRPFFFVALDKDDSSVKRMQSFLSVVPGEVTGCVGCHEKRTTAPVPQKNSRPLAARRKPSIPEPVRDIPDIIDFPRDIQPVLDKHCVKCHRPENYMGGILLTGDHGPIYSHSYYNLKARGEYVMGRNLAVSNYPPRDIGDAASPLMDKLDGSHHDAKLSEKEIKLLRYWINTGATYPGTYAALGTGSIGLNEGHLITDNSDLDLPEVQEMKAVLEKKCASCHQGDTRLATHPSYVHIQAWVVGDKTWKTNFMRDIVYNLSYPEKSLILLAPLSADAGGYGKCKLEKSSTQKAIFTSKNDPEYQLILQGIRAAGSLLDQRKRFDMEGFKPRREYVREMKKYGILPDSFDLAKDPIDFYKTDQRYWESLWYYPPGAEKPHLYENPYPESCLANSPSITQLQSSRSFICSDYGAQKVREFDRQGRVIWEHDARSCTDVTKLPSGNVLFATGKEVIEVTPGHMQVFYYKSEGEVNSCQRLSDGNTLIAESVPLRICEINPQGEIVKTIPLTCKNEDRHWALRHARKTPQGTYLVGHLGDNLAREYDAEGKIIRDFNAPGHVFMGQRLKNGHTLVSWQKGILEYDTAGNIVWELTEKDVPAMKLQFILGINRLDNGNTIVCNWLGWDAKGKGTPLFELNKDKKVVWQVPDSDKIGTITYMQVII